MDKIFEEKLEILAEDEVMMDAIKAVFDERINKEMPVVGLTIDDNVIGQQYRSYYWAKSLLYSILVDLISYKNNKKNLKNFNKAK